MMLTFAVETLSMWVVLLTVAVLVLMHYTFIYKSSGFELFDYGMGSRAVNTQLSDSLLGSQSGVNSTGAWKAVSGMLNGRGDPAYMPAMESHYSKDSALNKAMTDKSQESMVNPVSETALLGGLY
jgi:hypothetical protein